MPKVGKPKKWRRQFVRVPWAWVERLRTAKRVSTYRLALLLIYEHWRLGGRPIVLSNVSASQPKACRPDRSGTPWRSSRRLGLVEVREPAPQGAADPPLELS